MVRATHTEHCGVSSCDDTALRSTDFYPGEGLTLRIRGMAGLREQGAFSRV